MTDGERDQIDLDAQEFIRTCSDRIKALHGDGTCRLYEYTGEVLCMDFGNLLMCTIFIVKVSTTWVTC